MKNVLGLGFLIILASGVVLCPSPYQGKHQSGEDVIVREGHRVVVVEFEEDDGNTKITISPHDSHAVYDQNVDHEKLSETMENSEDKLIKEDKVHRGFSPKELVCDAYGKCKRKVESGMGKEKLGEVKDMASDAAQWTSDHKAMEAEEKKELSGILRRAREVAVDIFEYAVPPLSMTFVALHLLGFTAAYGMCAWVTFASSYVLATALTRHQFGVVQSKIYPVYLKAMAYSVGVAFLGHLMKVSCNNSGIGIGIFQAFNLMMSMVMILVNLFYLQPRANKVMLGRMKEQAGRGKQSETTTGEICCAFVNFMILMSLTCHLLHLGRRLHTSS